MTFPQRRQVAATRGHGDKHLEWGLEELPLPTHVLADRGHWGTHRRQRWTKSRRARVAGIYGWTGVSGARRGLTAPFPTTGQVSEGGKTSGNKAALRVEHKSWGHRAPRLPPDEKAPGVGWGSAAAPGSEKPDNWRT